MNSTLETLRDDADPIPFHIKYFLSPSAEKKKLDLTEDMKLELSKDLAYHVSGFYLEVVTEEEFNGGSLNCLTTAMIVEHRHFRPADAPKGAENDLKQFDLCNKLLHFAANLDAVIGVDLGSGPGTGAVGVGLPAAA